MDKWHVESYRLENDGRKTNLIIGEGTNGFGDGPGRIIGTIQTEKDANAIIEAHNRGLVATEAVREPVAAEARS